MRDLIKKVLSEHTIKKEVITEMATQDWCKKYSKIYPTYYFCSAAESYIRDEMQVFDNGQKGRKRKEKNQPRTYSREEKSDKEEKNY